jgi:hypothetical protein
MQTDLRIEMEMVGEGQVRVQMESEAGGQARGRAPVPFTLAELSVVLRALEINRAISEFFDREELDLLRTWGVVPGDFEAGASGQVKLGEEDIYFEELLGLVQERLYRTLFPTPEMNYGLAQTMGAIPPGQALHIRLELPAGNRHHPQDTQLFQYPWETLCYGSSHLWQNRRVSFSRYIQFQQPLVEPEPVARLNVLVVTSRPRTLPAGAGDDAGSMLNALRRRVARYPVRVRELPQATTKDMGDFIFERKGTPERPHALHFDGHGDFGRRCPNGHLSVNADADTCRVCGKGLPDSFSGYLAFEGGDGTAHWVSADELGDLLLDHDLKLVVLNACNSAVGGRGRDVFNGVAGSLVRRGIPAVIASSFQLDWEAALHFAHCFYQGLAQGEALVEVVDRARQRLRGLADTPREWYRPVLFLRQGGAGEGQLFQIEAGAETEATEEEEEVPQLHIYTFGDLPRELPEKALNWQRYFDRDTSPRTVPDPRTWERVLLPKLRERRAEIGRRGLIRLETPGPLSLGLAVGHTFKEAGQYQLEVAQPPPTPAQLWRSDEPPPEPNVSAPDWLARTLPGNPARREAAILLLATPRRGMPGLAREVGDYLGEAGVFERFIANGEGQSEKLQGVLFLEAGPVAGEDRFLQGWEAAALARASRVHLYDFVSRLRPETLHLFLAAPFGLTVFLGHQWNAINTLVQCYEFIGGPDCYAPACRLDLS